eukprot:g7464.t1
MAPALVIARPVIFAVLVFVLAVSVFVFLFLSGEGVTTSSEVFINVCRTSSATCEEINCNSVSWGGNSESILADPKRGCLFKLVASITLGGSAAT